MAGRSLEATVARESVANVKEFFVALFVVAICLGAMAPSIFLNGWPL